MMVKIGDKVKVVGGSGLDSGKVGVVLSPDSQAGRDGIRLEGGRYKPFDRKKELVIRGENSHIFTMFKSRVKKVSE